MTKIIEGNWIMEKDEIINEDLIVKGNILGKDGIRYNLKVAGDINARNIKYWAVCFAYKNIKCKSIKGKRDNHKEPFVLDGTIEIKEDKKQ